MVVLHCSFLAWSAPQLSSLSLWDDGAWVQCLAWSCVTCLLTVLSTAPNSRPEGQLSVSLVMYQVGPLASVVTLYGTEKRGNECGIFTQHTEAWMGCCKRMEARHASSSACPLKLSWKWRCLLLVMIHSVSAKVPLYPAALRAQMSSVSYLMLFDTPVRWEPAEYFLGSCESWWRQESLHTPSAICVWCFLRRLSTGAHKTEMTGHHWSGSWASVPKWFLEESAFLGAELAVVKTIFKYLTHFSSTCLQYNHRGRTWGDAQFPTFLADEAAALPIWFARGVASGPYLQSVAFPGIVG